MKSCKKSIAEQNIEIQGWINFVAGITFLIPVVTLLYKYSGLSDIQIIFISNITTFFIWLFELPTSVLADTYGRKRSLLASVSFNFLGALTILLFPYYIGFCFAALFASLYWSFWSGTGQAFLEENLKALGEEKKFGKYIGGFMFYEKLASIITPIIASMVLKFAGNTGYSFLALLDVITALILVILTLKLHVINKENLEFKSFKYFFNKNLNTGKNALKNVFGNSKLFILLIYRSLSHHTGLLLLMILPLLKSDGLPDYFGGFVITIGIIAEMISNKYCYKLSEKFSYSFSWILASVIQAISMIIIGLFSGNLVLVIIVYAVFLFAQGLLDPSWNHVLVENTRGRSIATTRSIIFAFLALYMTLGKQFASYFELNHFFIGLGIFIILVNVGIGMRVYGLRRD